MVIGVEGRWGSGKSSLVNMTVAALRASISAAEVIEFKPWLIGDRDSLLLALFTELAIAVDTIEEGSGDPVGRRRRELGDAGKEVVGFAAQLGGLGTLAKVAGAVVPGAALAGEAIEAIAKAAKGLDGKRSIAAEKAELRERLAALPRRIIVTIDDVDRL
ncbi:MULTISPECIES: KAP family NTPase [Bosea]|uniref:KAP family NTPase n=1 Tax=Bosea TaxID=85413 RepID=UPI00214F677C|nr:MULTISPECIES: KAP family NTPase [Bosea]MCR4524670.1 KAP family NTPase [Bosea sp. 47.2.35]